MDTVQRTSPLPFVCPSCFSQFDRLPPRYECPSCLGEVTSTAGWDLHWNLSRCHVLRECIEAKAWLPCTWLHKFAADELVRQGILDRFRSRESLKMAHENLNVAYRITDKGRLFLGAVEDCMIPDEVAAWYRGGLHLLDRLEENVAELRDGSDSGSPDLVLQYLKVFVREGRDMLAKRRSYSDLPPEADPMSIQSPP